MSDNASVTVEISTAPENHGEDSSSDTAPKSAPSPENSTFSNFASDMSDVSTVRHVIHNVLAEEESQASSLYQPGAGFEGLMTSLRSASKPARSPCYFVSMTSSRLSRPGATCPGEDSMPSCEDVCEPDSESYYGYFARKTFARSSFHTPSAGLSPEDIPVEHEQVLTVAPQFLKFYAEYRGSVDPRF
jgi:hypothetical protein